MNIPLSAPHRDQWRASGQFEEDSINAAILGQRQAEAVRVFDRAGWQ